MNDTSILTILMQAMVDHLVDHMMVDVSDSTRAGLIREGKLQADPTVAQINLLVRVGGKDWPHKRVEKGHHALPAELGHGFGMGAEVSEFWLRRFIVEMKFFFVGEIERDIAINKANILLSRLEIGLLTMPLVSLTDTFGETALMVDIDETYLNEGGGPGMFAHRGFAHVEFFTERFRA